MAEHLPAVRRILSLEGELSMAKIKYNAEDPDNANVFQMAAIKAGLALAYRIANDSPSELMQADRGIDIGYLRKKFNFPYHNGSTSNETIGQTVGEALTASLNHRMNL
jgi:hypothetical protein